MYGVYAAWRSNSGPTPAEYVKQLYDQGIEIEKLRRENSELKITVAALEKLVASRV